MLAIKALYTAIYLSTIIHYLVLKNELKSLKLR